MLTTDHYCAECLDPSSLWSFVGSSGPFVLTWILVALLARTRLFPALASDELKTEKDALPIFHTRTTISTTYGLRRWRYVSARSLAGLTFSTSLALSAVLVELLLCEISNTLDPFARGIAMRATLSCLLVLNVLLTPALEIHTLVQKMLGKREDSISSRSSRTWFRTLTEVAIFACWLIIFWYIPQLSLVQAAFNRLDIERRNNVHQFRDGCLERVGIIGILLMAVLAGFAAVSSLWRSFGQRHKAVNDVDIANKEAGLAAVQQMLDSKRSRFVMLQQQSFEAQLSASKSSFAGRLAKTFRGDPGQQELKTLHMEISGLETMQHTLSSSLSTLHSRYAEQLRSSTSSGRLINIFDLAFSIYCGYRICSTTVSGLRRLFCPDGTFVSSDPVNDFLALLTTHWDSTLDRDAWSRQISFLLTGFMLLASFSTVHQTFRLLSRFAPSVLQHAQTSLPLMVSQVAGAYVISSALLLRSSLPREMRSVISDALGAPLEGYFVEAWFEGWFLVSVVLTATGIFMSRRFGNTDDDLDDEWGGNKNS